MNSQLMSLVEQLRTAAPGSRITTDELSSGVVFIDVAINDRWFVFEFSPTRGVGVSENTEDTPPFVGHDTAFSTVKAAADHLLELVSRACLNPVGQAAA